MSQQNVWDAAAEIVRGTLREKGMAGNTEALRVIPDAVGSVKVDEAGLQKVLEQILESHNPLNALLGVLGFRLVNTRRLGGQSGVGLEASGQGLERLLAVDEHQLRAAVEKMAEALAAGESASGDEIRALQAKHNQLCQDLESTRQERAQISREYDAARQAVADRVQYILSLSGPADRDGLVAEQLAELLSDLEMEAVWPEGSADPALFSQIKMEDPERHKGKPCIRSGGQVLAKGICFVKADAAEA